MNPKFQKKKKIGKKIGDERFLRVEKKIFF